MLKRTPFHDMHVALGAKMVPFAGFEMPVQYPTGITAEHNAVRQKCGLFDVSHMGEFLVTGPQAIEFVNHVTTNNVAALAVGQVHYSGILNERGTFEDDCLVYRFADHVMMVVNASNKDKDFAHISKQLAKFDAKLEDVSDRIALLALQGPDAQRILQPLTGVALEPIGYYHFDVGTVAGCKDIIVSRTGYTGEDGFELYFDARHAATIWDALMAAGNVLPVGLGCRDSLRLEMGMALYGNDIDDTVTPLEANLQLAREDEEGRLHRQSRARGAEGGRRAAQARGLHDRRKELPAPRLQGVRERRAERRGAQRHHEPEHGNRHRHRVRARGPRQAGKHARGGDSREPPERDDRGAAVLHQGDASVRLGGRRARAA